MAQTYIVDQVTTDNVRHALGMTDNEMPDAMLIGQNLEVELVADLLSWYPNYRADWEAYQNPPGTPTDEEVIKGSLIQLYCQWFCAVRISETWLAMPSQIGDGKATMRRFANLDLKTLLSNAQKKRGSFKSQLKDLTDPSRIKGFGIVGRATPDIDPVTGPYPNAAYNNVRL